MKLSTKRRQPAGYLLLEVMLAIGLYGFCVTALMKALTKSSMLAVETQLDSRVLIRLDSKMTQFHKMNNLAEWEGKTDPDSGPDAMNIWTSVDVTRIEDLKTTGQNGGAGQELRDMYKVVVKAFYQVDWKTEPEVMQTECWRYLPLYRTQGSTANGTAPGGQPGAPAPSP
jgi:hypothetical protein